MRSSSSVTILYLSFLSYLTLLVAAKPTHNNHTGHYNTSAKYSTLINRPLSNDSTSANHSACSSATANSTKFKRADAQRNLPPVPPDPPQSLQGVLAPSLEPIRRWIQQSTYLNQADAQNAGWERWAVPDISFRMNIDGHQTEFEVRTFYNVQNPSTQSRKSMDLKITIPSRSLIEFKVYNYNDWSGLQTLDYYFDGLANDRAKFRNNILLPEYQGFECFVVGIASGYAIRQGLRNAFPNERNAITDQTYLQVLQNRHGDYSHVLVRGLPGSRGNLGYVISYRQVGCRVMPQIYDPVTVAFVAAMRECGYDVR